MFDKLKYPGQLWEERRKSVHESLSTITVDELKKIVTEHEEEFLGSPPRDEFLRLMDEKPQPSFYTAVPQQDVIIYYCSDADFGVWVLIGSGMGPLDANGKRLMKEAIELFRSGAKIGIKK